MARKPNYDFEKRRKEAERKAKADAKAEAKAQRKKDEAEGIISGISDEDAAALGIQIPRETEG